MKFGNFFFFLFSVLADASFSSVLNFSKKSIGYKSYLITRYVNSMRFDRINYYVNMIESLMYI